MPLYEYRCQSCGRTREVLQKMSDPPVTVCEHCGGEMKRMVSAPAVQFKGTGWYVTDYAKKSGDGGRSGGSFRRSRQGRQGGQGGARASDGGGSSSSEKPAEKMGACRRRQAGGGCQAGQPRLRPADLGLLSPGGEGGHGGPPYTELRRLSLLFFAGGGEAELLGVVAEGAEAGFEQLGGQGLHAAGALEGLLHEAGAGSSRGGFRGRGRLRGGPAPR